MGGEFRYDIAFSFLNEDEQLVREIDALLRPRLTTFAYFDHQKEIAGTDGEETFNRVFEKDARTVTIFFRARWGEAGFTLIEKTAIRNRAYDKGYEFATFVNLDSSTLPSWVPKTRIWGNLAYGVDAVAAVLEARAVDSGAEARVETIAEHAARLKTEAEFLRWRQNFLNSEGGVSAAEKESKALLDTVAAKIALIPEFNTEQRTREIIVRGEHSSLIVSWHSKTINSVKDATMTAGVLDRPYYPNGPRVYQPNLIKAREFKFDVRSRDTHAWREGDRLFTTSQLASELLEFMLTTSEKHINAKLR